MTLADPIARPTAPGRRTVDIAGTPWPVYKLEALALAVPVFVLAFVVGSLQVAVLAAAAVAAVRWLVGAGQQLRARLIRQWHPSGGDPLVTRP